MTKPWVLWTVAGVVAAGFAALLLAAATARAAEPEPPVPEPEPEPEPDDDIVPPPDNPRYAPLPDEPEATPFPYDVPPNADGSFPLDQGGRYRAFFQIESWLRFAASPPIVMQQLEQAGWQAPQAWKLDSGGWQAEATWSGESGDVDPPQGVSISKLERIA